MFSGPQVIPVFAGGLDFSSPVKKFFFDPLGSGKAFVSTVVSLTGGLPQLLPLCTLGCGVMFRDGRLASRPAVRCCARRLNPRAAAAWHPLAYLQPGSAMC